MSTSAFIDCDRIATTVLADLSDAAKGWLRGRPTDEVALLNRITENLDKHRRTCDIGVKHPVTISSKTYMLHRQGSGQTDLYGSDLAVTLFVPGGSFLKTAFFQLKKCDQFNLSLERSQLEASQLDSYTAANSFVMAVNEKRIGFRIETVSTLLPSFSTQKTLSFDALNWMFLTDWLLRWLTCSIGMQSQPKEPTSVEAMLRNYITDTDVFDFDWVPQTERLLQGLIIPVRAWLIITFE